MVNELVSRQQQGEVENSANSTEDVLPPVPVLKRLVELCRRFAELEAIQQEFMAIGRLTFHYICFLVCIFLITQLLYQK
jgi:hypothetical protein